MRHTASWVESILQNRRSNPDGLGDDLISLLRCGPRSTVNYCLHDMLNIIKDFEKFY